MSVALHPSRAIFEVLRRKAGVFGTVVLSISKTCAFYIFKHIVTRLSYESRNIVCFFRYFTGNAETARSELCAMGGDHPPRNLSFTSLQPTVQKTILI